MSSGLLRAAVVGASGYAGAEVVRLLLGHPRVEVTTLCAQRHAGEPLARVLPSLAGLWQGTIEAFDADAVAAAADLVFCALPHGVSAPVVASLRERGLLVVDLSADFRLRDLGVYAAWYGEHGAPGLIDEAVYGLVELERAALRDASLIAVPGCYPTATILALAPLLDAGLVEVEGIVVDAKSGVSGAGRSPSPGTHLPETAEGIRAYKAAGAHRHTPEIEQALSRVAGQEVRITFTPHLVPMTRGLLATCYAMAANGATAEACTEAARAFYDGSPSVAVLDPNSHPDTLWVRGSNRAHLAYACDERTGRVLAMSAIDNLIKGAAGQAVQCMNVRFGFPEGDGLGAPAVWP